MSNATSELKAAEQLLFNDALLSVNKFDLVSASGSEALSFLQGQLSQNVESMAVGETRRTLLLSPQGKLVSWCRVVRTGEDAFLFVCDVGSGAEVVARLEMFKLRTKISIELDGAALAWSLRGPQSEWLLGELDLAEVFQPVPLLWRDRVGMDLIFSKGAVPDGHPEMTASPEVLEVERVLSGLPKFGAELDSSTIAAAAGLVETSVDFTKGCYVGQELVARIDSRGNHTPTRLVSFVVERSAADSKLLGEPVLSNGAEVGTLTSFVWSNYLAQGRALGYLKRSALAPAGGAPTAFAAGQYELKLLN